MLPQRSSLRFRQIHLDFHTSEDVPGVGTEWDKAQFQEALKRGHVDSITLFSKCHHGWSYHATSVGKRHPTLNFDLLPRQIEACREIDVKCPIYISAGFDELAAFEHPEWIAVARDGKQLNPTQAGWKALGFETPYLDYLVAQIREVVENLDAEDGIFLDIIHPRNNFSPLGLLAMENAGVNPNDEDAVHAWNGRVFWNYLERTTEASLIGDPARRVFHNSGHVYKGARGILRFNSHLELESLPTGGWGYDHFPASASYASTLRASEGFDFLGMTGKFHTTWGEFGGFKRPEALRYECAAMLAWGAKCSIGDQLHPNGAMNFDTYDLIGHAYAEVEAKEPWCEGATPMAQIALVSSEALRGGPSHGSQRSAVSEEGAARMLLELHQSFDVVDLECDLSGYDVVILPDEITLEGALRDKIAAYLKNGGKLLLSAQSGLNPAKTEFALDFGLELCGWNEFDPSYLVPTDAAPTPLVRGPFVVHGKNTNVRLRAGQEAAWQPLATRRDPYFNRAWNHFCSHQHTPDATDSEFVGVVSNGQIAYFGQPIFEAYRQIGQPLLRDVFADALRTLLPQPLVETNLPTTARVVLNRQDEAKRAILHLLFAVPVKRGADRGSRGSGAWNLEVIEDLFPLFDVACRVQTGADVTGVRLVPSGESLPFEQESGTVSFSVPKLLCHQMVELQF